eukprot:2048387-Prymnesium_polylepis.1
MCPRAVREPTSCKSVGSAACACSGSAPFPAAVPSTRLRMSAVPMWSDVAIIAGQREITLLISAMGEILPLNSRL